jgi:membrane associated rhomboid family serine protease
LNGENEQRCYRCGKRIPGPFVSETLTLVRSFLGSDAPLTKLLLGMELITFALCVLIDKNLPLFLGGFHTSTLLRFGALHGALVDHEPWRYLSACFVHAGVLHVGMNMFMFTSLGAKLEHEFGPWRAALIFVLSGILGFVVSDIWSGGRVFSVGASGGVFGQVGALIGVLAARRDPLWKRALTQMLVYAVLLTFALPGVDTGAHLGGFFAGIALGFGLYVVLRTLRLNRLMAVLGVLGVLASAASIVLSGLSPEWKAARQYELLQQ